MLMRPTQRQHLEETRFAIRRANQAVGRKSAGGLFIPPPGSVTAVGTRLDLLGPAARCQANSGALRPSSRAMNERSCGSSAAPGRGAPPAPRAADSRVQLPFLPGEDPPASLREAAGPARAGSPGGRRAESTPYRPEAGPGPPLDFRLAVAAVAALRPRAPASGRLAVRQGPETRPLGPAVPPASLLAAAEAGTHDLLTSQFPRRKKRHCSPPKEPPTRAGLPGAVRVVACHLPVSGPPVCYRSS